MEIFFIILVFMITVCIAFTSKSKEQAEIMNYNSSDYKQELSDKEQKINKLFEMKKKSKGTGYLLLLLFGGIGAHAVFIKDYASFIIYLVFFIIGLASGGGGFVITAIFLFIQLFAYSGQVDKYNEKIKLELELQYK